MKKTYTPKPEDIKQEWHLIDAEGMILGKLASKAAPLLIGKHKPTYTTHVNMGDKVVIINAAKFIVTGKKSTDKTYHRVTGFPGAVKSETLDKLIIRKPTEAVRKAIRGMLPKNKLLKERMKNLYIYKGSEHPHKAQIK